MLLIGFATFMLIHVALDDAFEASNKELLSTNEAPATDFGSLFVILVLCLFFCIAVRHLNDFYVGDTVTLVEEGTWKGRFRHRPQYLYLRKIQNDFDDMMNQLRESDKKMWHDDEIPDHTSAAAGIDS
ncbi:hypothetical protein Tcan_18111 [Toxocara canis]|uniref:Uncharacterized protein n=2 Tax=Toxocara canis TaxID=6265 RepID=A0A0B2UZQ2_TOXCA|nr:hypothetical protein Tcan_18111 [Toxocara canis]VDM40697.1 unnamed protein product [Toxocara canis]